MKSRIRIGYQIDFPPFMHGPETPGGLVIDALASGVDALRQAGAEVVWVPLTLADQERALVEGQVDLLAGLGNTPERTRRLVFGRPLVRTGGALFTRPGTSTVRRVVTPTSGPLRGPARDAFPHCEVLDAADYPDALAQVLDGTADAAALNIHVGAVLAERDHAGAFDPPEAMFAAVDLAPAYAPAHDPDLRRVLDEHSVSL